MRRILIAITITLLALFGARHLPLEKLQGRLTQGSAPSVAGAYSQQHSGRQVSGEGQVVKILSDDTEGSQHQRFILKLPSRQTILVAHNIDLAPRINTLAVGDSISFMGVYEWNDKGGVVHWTHHDPKGKHAGGWLKKGSSTYQ